MFGFTRKEQGVLLFLVSAFLIGIGVRVYQENWGTLPETAVLNIEEKIHKSLVPEATLHSLEHEMPDNKRTDFVEKIELNFADQRVLEKLPGIGPVIAARIIDYRKINGPFGSIEDLKQVRGIGLKKFKSIEGNLIVDTTFNSPGINFQSPEGRK